MGELDTTDNPFVRQFVSGSATGPIDANVWWAGTRLSPLVAQIDGPHRGRGIWASAPEMIAAGRDVMIPAGVGDRTWTLPHRCAPRARQGTRCRAPIIRRAGRAHLRAAVAAQACGLYGVPVAAEVVICAGAQGRYAVLQVVAGPGDEVIVLARIYLPPACIAAAGAGWSVCRLIRRAAGR